MAQDLEKKFDEICEALDNLAIKNLELIEEKVLLTVSLEKSIRQGHINLAKARYIRGKENVGILQIPSKEHDIKSLFDLETTFRNSEEDKQEKDFPHYDICLKKCGEGEDEPQNPIKWFGVLVPQSLKIAQKHFQDALYVAVRLANLQAELAKTKRQSDSLKVLKTEAA
ncbi:coiled-coil domain-containing protein 115 [Copidosoma floridanum]|uniref:coiled-coil domain-containing protein 115 n=1 Tax=Copidosoma floridanum TaxID=29053 RepID=UPI0006C9AF23|nr:coiled-coil domain-containing protein 115 [Copidosoma floridanum]